jgi:2-methylisocitrate lyase-like PEP mutase family enzyme
MLPLPELHEFRMVLFANAALQGAIKGTQRVLDVLHRTGSLASAREDLATWDERQRLVGKPAYDELEQRYAT